MEKADQSREQRQKDEEARFSAAAPSAPSDTEIQQTNALLERGAIETFFKEHNIMTPMEVLAAIPKSSDPLPPPSALASSSSDVLLYSSPPLPLPSATTTTGDQQLHGISDDDGSPAATAAAPEPPPPVPMETG